MKKGIRKKKAAPERVADGIWQTLSGKMGEPQICQTLSGNCETQSQNLMAASDWRSSGVRNMNADTSSDPIWQPSVAKLTLDQRSTVGSACRAGLSSNARTASERLSNQHRRFPSGPASFDRRSRHVAKSSSARRTYRTQSLPAVTIGSLRTLSP